MQSSLPPEFWKHLDPAAAQISLRHGPIVSQFHVPRGSLPRSSVTGETRERWDCPSSSTGLAFPFRQSDNIEMKTISPFYFRNGVPVGAW
jgi:hypothetical protein